MIQTRMILGAVSLGLAVGLGYALRAAASGVPATNALTYAGVLEDAAGPVNASHNIQLMLYDAASAGNSLCQSVSAAVTVTNGHFSVPLPDACTTAVGANPNVWVDVLVDGSDTGRTKTGAVPYAVEANHAVNATNATTAVTANSAASATSATSASTVPWSGVTAVPAPIQAIGNGAIQVASGGQIGVGTSTPLGRFTVADSAQTDPSGLPANNVFLGHIRAANGWDATGMCATGGVSAGDMCTGNNGSWWYWGYQTDPATITTIMQLSTTGALTISGTLTQNSSAAFKKDIHFLDDAELDEVLRTIEATPVATYRYNGAAAGSKINYGVIAEKTPSSLLSDNDRGVNLSNTIGALLASVKAQQAHIARLEAQRASMSQLDERLRQLERRCGP